jgi:DNA-binding MarR family transcriptional regulator
MADRRIVRLSLTEKGRKLLKILAQHKLDGIRSATDNLTDDELGRLYKLILKMSNK